jgi:starvation-inducible DNA-binding protein
VRETGIIEDARKNIERLDDMGPITQDILVGHAGALEKFQWFMRAHLETAGGALAHDGATTETSNAPCERRLSSAVRCRSRTS